MKTTLGINKLLVPLTKQQSFVIIILILIAFFTLDYLKEDQYIKALGTVGKKLDRLIEITEKNNEGVSTKAGAIFIYSKTYSAAKRNIRLEMSRIIKQNNITDVYRRQEVTDLLRHRVTYMYKMDYIGLSDFRYGGIPLSYVLKDFDTVYLSDRLLEYLFANAHEDPTEIIEGIDKILNNIFNEYLTASVESLNKS